MKNYSFEIFKIGENELYIKSINTESIEKNFESNYDDFFGYWKELLEGQKRVTRFELVNDVLYFEVTNFRDDGYRDFKGSFRIKKELLEDTNFMLFLSILLVRFKSIKQSSISAVDILKDSYFSSQKLQSLAETYLKRYNGECEDISKELRNAIGDYVRTNAQTLKKSVPYKLSFIESALSGAISPAVLFAFCYFLGFSSSTIVLLGIMISVTVSGFLSKVFEVNGQTKALNKFVEQYSDIGDQKEKAESELRNKLQTAKDEMFEFVLNDTNFMRNMKDDSISSLCRRFDRFIAEFSSCKTDEICKGFPIPKLRFLERLADLETEMYRVNRPERIQFIGVSEVAITKEIFFARLEYLGFPREMVENDFHFAGINRSLNRILDMPYSGCEAEILALLKIAQSYYSSEERICNAELLKRIGQVDDEIKMCINIAFKNEGEPEPITCTYKNGFQKRP